jgi:lysozyme
MRLRRSLGPAVLLAALGSCSAPAAEVARAVDDLVVCGRGPTVEGIDVSQYQATVNWPVVRLAGKRFAIARVYHSPSRDLQFDRNWHDIRANGLIRGAYIYFDPRAEVAAQADVVVRAVGRLAQGDLPVTLDVEQPPPGLPTPARYAAMVRDLADRIEAGTGRRPMIYTGHYYWPTYVQSAAFGAYPLWHAQYTTTLPCPNIADAWHDWAFWQYSSTGRVTGIIGNVDLDRFNGTYADLQRLAGYPDDADAGAARDAPPGRAVPDAPDASDAPMGRDAVTTRDATADDATRSDAAAVDTASELDAAVTIDAPAPDLPTFDVGERDAAVEVDATADPPPAAPDSSGCGCHTGATPARGAPVVAALAGALLLSRRRRSRRRG